MDPSSSTTAAAASASASSSSALDTSDAAAAAAAAASKLKAVTDTVPANILLHGTASSTAPEPAVLSSKPPVEEKKRNWTIEEDDVVMAFVDKCQFENVKVKWSVLSKLLPGRTGKQCRERFHNNLDPNIKKDQWSVAEEMILLDAQQTLGNKWSEIAKLLPGRSDNAIKNHWNASLRKKQVDIGKIKIPIDIAMNEVHVKREQSVQSSTDYLVVKPRSTQFHITSLQRVLQQMPNAILLSSTDFCFCKNKVLGDIATVNADNENDSNDVNNESFNLATSPQNVESRRTRRSLAAPAAAASSSTATTSIPTIENTEQEEEEEEEAPPPPLENTEQQLADVKSTIPPSPFTVNINGQAVTPAIPAHAITQLMLRSGLYHQIARKSFDGSQQTASMISSSSPVVFNGVPPAAAAAAAEGGGAANRKRKRRSIDAIKSKYPLTSYMFSEAFAVGESPVKLPRLIPAALDKTPKIISNNMLVPSARIRRFLPKYPVACSAAFPVAEIFAEMNNTC